MTFARAEKRIHNIFTKAKNTPMNTTKRSPVAAMMLNIYESEIRLQHSGCDDVCLQFTVLFGGRFYNSKDRPNFPLCEPLVSTCCGCLLLLARLCIQVAYLRKAAYVPFFFLSGFYQVEIFRSVGWQDKMSDGGLIAVRKRKPSLQVTVDDDGRMWKVGFGKNKAVLHGRDYLLQFL